MYIEIKNRFDDSIILSGEYNSLKDALEKNVGANLYGASLNGANLYGANLYGASLDGASLNGASLIGANLIGAFVFICGSRHNLQYNKSIGELRIGCHAYHLEYWLIMFDVIGREEEYSDKQIAEYHNYMKMLKNYL